MTFVMEIPLLNFDIVKRSLNLNPVKNFKCPLRTVKKIN